MNIEENNLFQALSKTDQNLLVPHMQVVKAQIGDVLIEPGDNVKYCYFPCGPTLVSFMVLMEDARTVEVAIIGREGAVGGIVSQGKLPASCRTVVHYEGTLMRIELAKLEEAKQASVTIRHFFARYADCLLAQIFQSAACNATHTIEQRTAKWLMVVVGHTQAPEIRIGQEQLAGLLGIGRSYVARVLGGLKARGIVLTMRGRMRIEKINELAAISCNCNKLVKQHFDTVLKGVYPTAE
jgi:CRP-like cAMP-binding protein